MKNNNPLNMAHQLAAQRTQTAVDRQSSAGALGAQGMAQQLNNAADPGQNRLGIVNRFRARRHESVETLTTAKEVITHREIKIRLLATEAIDAQIDLMRAELKQRFSTEFAVIAARGMAAFIQAQNTFHAVVDAGCDQIHENLCERVDDLTARYQAGRFSQVAYENEMVRAQRQSDLQINNLEASCAQCMNTMNNSFNSSFNK